MTATRRLAAILVADVAGSSRLMGADEERTVARLQAHYRQLVEPKIREYRGRVVRTTGDGVLVEFPSVVDAVRCAVEIQRSMIGRNHDTPEDQRIAFRIGVNLGDIIVENHDIFGDGVNIAARLQELAEPGGICISRVVRDQVRDRLPFAFDDLGEQRVKNIARPVRVYAMSAGTIGSLPPIGPSDKRVMLVSAPRLSIVVLPFANLTADPEQEYFAEAITDDLTTDLSRIAGSFVIARNTAFTYKHKSVDAKQIGRDLGVRYVLEGSLRRTGDKVRVNVQLIDSESGAHIWADRFETDPSNLGRAQDEITGRLARTLNVELVAAAGRRIEQEQAVDPDVRDLVMRGWASFYRPYAIANREEALRNFDKALELDPQSLDARIGLALVLVSNISDGWTGTVERDTAKAEQLLLEAVERDAHRSMARVAMGMLRRIQNRLVVSRIELETAIALDRNNARAFRQLGQTLMFLGQPEAAIPCIEKAIQLNPRDPNIAIEYRALGLCRLFIGSVDAAIDLLTQARAANPRLWSIHLHLAGALGFRGDLEEASAALGDSLDLKPEINSLASLRAFWPWITNSQHWALLDKTVNLGLRRVGFPEE